LSEVLGGVKDVTVRKRNRQSQSSAVRRPGRPFNSFEGESLTRELAVSRALALVREKGLDGLTMQALARSLAVSRAPIYALFNSRQALVAEVSDVILSRIFLDDAVDTGDWRNALRELALRGFNTYRAYPGIASHLSRMGFPDTEAGRRSARLLSGLMSKAGAPAELIPTLIFASTSMIAGADLEMSGQVERELQVAGSGEGKAQLERRRGKTLSPKPMGLEMFLEANELVLLGIEALINK